MLTPQYCQNSKVILCWSVHAIPVPNNPFIKKPLIHIRVLMPCPCTMDVHSIIFKWMDSSAWILPWILHGQLTRDILKKILLREILSRGYHICWRFCSRSGRQKTGTKVLFCFFFFSSSFFSLWGKRLAFWRVDSVWEYPSYFPLQNSHRCGGKQTERRKLFFSLKDSGTSLRTFLKENILLTRVVFKYGWRSVFFLSFVFHILKPSGAKCSAWPNLT